MILPSPRVVWTDALGEFVILNPRSGTYHGVQGVGALIWRLLVDGRTIAEIERSVCAEYDVDASQCRADIVQFLQGVRGRDLITVQDDVHS